MGPALVLFLHLAFGGNYSRPVFPFELFCYKGPMSQKKNIDVSHVRFNSTVFPTDEDMKLWNSLSPEEQRAVIERDEEAAFQSGIAKKETLEERLARVRAKMVHAL